MTKMKLGTLAAGLATVLASTSAMAEVTVLKVAPGIGGPKRARGGPGNEQPAQVTLEKGGVRYVVMVYMSSNVPQQDRPWQGKCTSFKLDPMTGPQIVADQVAISHFSGGDRPWNHPALATDGTNIMMLFGSDSVNGGRGNTQTYAAAIDENCNVLGDMNNPLRISNNANNNQGAPDIKPSGTPGVFNAGYYDNNNQRTYIRGITVGTDGLPVKTYLKTAVTPSNIGRPNIVTISSTRAMVCAAKGDQRPPEDGVECVMYNTADGTIIWKNLVAASDPQNHVYMNQPSVAMLDGGVVGVQVIQSSGQGRNKNKKGSSQPHVLMMHPDDTGPNIAFKTDALGAYDYSHSGICSSAYGADGVRQISVVHGSITGSGIASVTVAKPDMTGLKMLISSDKAVNAENGDSGYLANIYGENPHTQGRDFMVCMGDVPNPGFGVTGGFQSQVKSFLFVPSSGMVKGEPKNALFASFVPAHTPSVTPPAEPPPAVNPTPPVVTDPGVGAPSNTGHENWGTSVSVGAAPSMFACSMGNGQTSTGGLGSLVLVGLALGTVTIIRRRAGR